jgi:hypothetical protein
MEVAPEAEDTVVAAADEPEVTVAAGSVLPRRQLAYAVGVYALALAAGVWRGGSAAAAAVDVPFSAASITVAGSNPLRLTQGDEYLEPGLSMGLLDAHVKAHHLSPPKLSFEYSDAGVAFSDYLAGVGSFEVAYTVDAPWLERAVTLRRTVQVADVNECAYAGSVAAFVANCADSNQTCTNTEGAYECH